MLLSLGIDHQRASQDERARFQDPGKQAAVFAACREVADEVLVLSTCGRFEVYVAGAALEAGEVVSALEEVFGTVRLGDGGFTLREGRAAARHLFRVAAGLESEILGEGEVLRQVKEAADWARAQGGLGGELGLLCRAVVAAGKRVRAVTGIAAGAVSIGTLAADEARAILGDLASAQALVLGAGEVAGLVLRHLKAYGLAEPLVASRTPAHARAAAAAVGGRAISWQDVDEALVAVDLVVSATSAPHVVLDHRRLEYAARRRRGRRLLVLDLAQPRDVDPRARGVRGVVLRDLAELSARADAHRRQREAAVTAAEAELGRALEAYEREVAERRAAPLLRALNARAEAVLAAELRRLAQTSGLDEDRLGEVEVFARRLVAKLLYEEMVGLKEEVRREGEGALELARRLFRLPVEPAGPGVRGG